MQKTRFISMLAVGLLVANIILVAFFFMNRNEHHPPHGPDRPRNIIIERLHFTEGQVQEYDKLIQAHRAAVHESDSRIMALKNKLYSLLSNPMPSPEKDSLISAIAQAQRDIELVHYNHFEDIKHLCTTEQKHYFKMLAEELATLFSHPRPKHKPH